MILADVLETFAAALLLCVTALVALFTRRVVIRRRGGTFDCSLRLTPVWTGPVPDGLPGSARAAAHAGHLGRSGYSGSSGHADQDGVGAAGAPGLRDAGGGIGSGGSSGAAGPPGAASPVHGEASARQAAHVQPEADARPGRGWAYGIAQYRDDRIDWFRIFSYSYRPAAGLTRRELEVVGRRDAEGHDELALFPGWTIVECRYGAGLVELAMSPDALTGFLSWLEAAPPGQDIGRVA